MSPGERRFSLACLWMAVLTAISSVAAVRAGSGATASPSNPNVTEQNKKIRIYFAPEPLFFSTVAVCETPNPPIRPLEGGGCGPPLL